MTQGLDKLYKGLFPFQLGTTFFIYQAGWSENASRLGSFFDQMELPL